MLLGSGLVSRVVSQRALGAPLGGVLWVLPTTDTAVSPWNRLSLSPGTQYVQCSARRRHGEIHPPFSLQHSGVPG